MASTDILLFVEDPSAANYAALLLAAFSERGWSARLCGAGVAPGMLRSRGVDCFEAGAGTSAADLLATVKPRCVMVGTAENPDTLGLQLIAAARDAGIPAVAFIDALLNFEYRFRGRTSDPLAHAPDWLLVPDEWTSEAFRGLGFPQDRISVCGHPQYDATLALASKWDQAGARAMRERLFPQVDLDRRILTFISEGSIRYELLPPHPVAEYGFKGRSKGKGRTKVVLEEVLDAIADIDPRPYFVFRAHPIESADDYREYGAEIDDFNSGGSALELIYASDLVAGMTSMLLLEAALLGRSTLAILPQEAQKEWLPSVRSGIAPYAADRASLRSHLSRMLQGAPAAARPGKDIVVTQATQRVAGVVASVIHA